jgi:hypothetical protein
LSADARSLEVLEALGGVKPLTDKERSAIRRNIDDKVLRGQPIAFRSTAVRPPSSDGRLAVEGDLTMAGSTRLITAQRDVTDGGHVTVALYWIPLGAGGHSVRFNGRVFEAIEAASIGHDATSITQRWLSSWTALATRSRSRLRRTPTRRVEACRCPRSCLIHTAVACVLAIDLGTAD